MVGYDTFESIRTAARNEAKDSKDYYNVTVSMVISRAPVSVAEIDPAVINDVPLSQTLDKGFPYDD